MHEWALAEAVISSAAQIAEKEGLKKVVEVSVKIGELQQVERDILRFALEELKSERFKDTKFRISTAKTKLSCKVCGHSWYFDRHKLEEATAEAIHFVPEVAHTYIKCPNCGSPDFETVEGRGVYLEGVKGLR